MAILLKKLHLTPASYFASIVITIIMTMVAGLNAADRKVPSDHSTIQAAIDACDDGDEVVISPGVYQGTGNCDLDFKGKEIIVRSENPQDSDCVAKTTIDCQGSQESPHRAFIFQNDEDKYSAVAGLTIINGYATRGGAIYCEKSGPTISWCTFKKNMAENGGGVACYQAKTAPTITNCTFAKNKAKNTGGGIYCTGSENLKIINCLISQNKTEGYGGGVYSIENKDLLISNCTVVQNRADFGGGIYGLGDSRAIALVKNSIIWDNDSGEIDKKFAWDALDVTYCNISGGWDGTGNINLDPQLDSDFRLTSNSPCIDKGEPNGRFDEQMDIDSDDRVSNGRVDIGCDEI